MIATITYVLHYVWKHKYCLACIEVQGSVSLVRVALLQLLSDRTRNLHPPSPPTPLQPPHQPEGWDWEPRGCIPSCENCSPEVVRITFTQISWAHLNSEDDGKCNVTKSAKIRRIRFYEQYCDNVYTLRLLARKLFQDNLHECAIHSFFSWKIIYYQWEQYKPYNKEENKRSIQTYRQSLKYFDNHAPLLQTDILFCKRYFIM